MQRLYGAQRLQSSVLETCVKKIGSSLKEWTLTSGRLNDGDECLVLKMPTGETFCEYTPALRPYTHWHVYYNGFPKKSFMNREACIRDAERIAGHAITVRRFPEIGRIAR